MISVREIYEFIDDIAPFSTSFEWDNTGLLVGDMNQNVKNVLIALDVTEEVILEACRLGCNLIVSHHPVIFKPIKSVSSDSILCLALKNDLNIICAHTNLDLSEEGVNKSLANKFSLKNIKSLRKSYGVRYNKIVIFSPKGFEDKIIDALAKNGAGKLGNYSKCSFSSEGMGKFVPELGSNPYIGGKGTLEKTEEIRIEMICPENKTACAIESMKKAHPYEEPAYDVFKDYFACENRYDGAIGDLESPMNADKFLNFVKEKINCEMVRFTETGGRKIINKVALCGGAGGSYVKDAINAGADVFLTGEIKHSDILEANRQGLMIVDAGHYKTEDPAMNNLKNILKGKFKSINFYKSQEFTDKIKYV